MNIDNLCNLGMEKIAEDENQQNQQGKMQRLKQMIANNPGKAGALTGAGLGAGANALMNLKQRRNMGFGNMKMMAQMYGGADDFRNALNRETRNTTARGAVGGAALGALAGKGAKAISERRKDKEKTSSIRRNNMNYENLYNLGLEKVAKDEQKQQQNQQGKLQRLKQMITNNPGKAGALLGGAAGVAGGALGGRRSARRNGPFAQGVAQGMMENGRIPTKRDIVAGGGTLGGLAGAGAGALAGKGAKKLHGLAQKDKQMTQEALNKLKRDKEKTSSADVEEMYVDGLQKVASVAGIEPEVLDEAIAMHQQELVKEAQIDALLANVSEEEAGEILKEAAATSPELQGAIAEHEETSENEELSKLAGMIDSLGDEEAEELLNELE